MKKALKKKPTKPGKPTPKPALVLTPKLRKQKRKAGLKGGTSLRDKMKRVNPNYYRDIAMKRKTFAGGRKAAAD